MEKCFRSTLTGLVCALLILAFFTTAQAQTTTQGGFSISRDNEVSGDRSLAYMIEGGNNQRVDDIFLTYAVDSEATKLRRLEIVNGAARDSALTVMFPGLKMAYEPTVTTPGDTAGDPGVEMAKLDIDTAEGKCPVAPEVGQADERTLMWNFVAGTGDAASQVMICVPGNLVANETTNAIPKITVSDIRLDVSGLKAEEKVNVSVRSSVDPGTIDLTNPLGGGDAVGPIAVGVVKTGVVFKAGVGVGLSCALTNTPSATVSIVEGFTGAWNDWHGSNKTGIQFRLVLSGVPGAKDDKVSWAAGMAKVDLNPGPEKNEQIIGTLTVVAPKGVKDGSEVVFEYAPSTEHDLDNEYKRSFTVTGTASFAGAASVGVEAQLWPPAGRSNAGDKSDLEDVLSFEYALSVPPNADDKSTANPETEWLEVSECITYLLYPFVTCGASDGWTTGISVANTSPDPDNVVFGEFDDLKGQAGAVTAYAFPKNGNGAPPLASQITPNLPAGNTLSFTCSENAVLAGFEGYMIIKSGFQNARGMAFVIGDFDADGIHDVAHGYVAEVIGEGDPTDRADNQ